MAVQVSSEVLIELRSEAVYAHPNECCGLLLGTGRRITTALPARNTHLTPQTHFEIDPQTLVDAHKAQRAGGPEVLGYYHSHPRGPGKPSKTDQASASRDARIWAIIGADNDVTFWLDDESGFAALPYAVTDR